jgi:hypothetical protein
MRTCCTCPDQAGLDTARARPSPSRRAAERSVRVSPPPRNFGHSPERHGG